jgi:hypothetical protein
MGNSENTRISRAQFHHFINELSTSMESPPDFDEFTEYLISSVKLSVEEEKRKDQRMKWVKQIQLQGQTNFLDIDPALLTAASAIQQNAKMFGKHTHASVCVGLLDPADQECLVFRAASEDCRECMVGQKLHSCDKQVSFSAVVSGRPVYVPSIRRNSNVHLFNPESIHSSETDGALLVAPICSPLGRILGTVNMDTLGGEKTAEEGDISIATHEQHFCQGVAVVLGGVVHCLEVRHKFLSTIHTAVEWMFTTCPNIAEVDVYFVEPTPSTEALSRPASSTGSVDLSDNIPQSDTPTDTPTLIPAHLKQQLVLRHVLEKKVNNQTTKNRSPQRMFFHENLFKQYLFDGVESSAATMTESFGMSRLCHPVRDHTGCAVAVVDIASMKTQPMGSEELRECMKVLKLVAMAYHQLSCGRGESESRASLTRPTKVSFACGPASLFDQLLLSDAREKVKKLDSRVFTELKSNLELSSQVHQLIRALLMVFYPQCDFQEWTSCKQYLTTDLVLLVEGYDPCTSKMSEFAKIKDIVDGLDTKVIMKSSYSTRRLYTWLVVCLYLTQYTTEPNT